LRSPAKVRQSAVILADVATDIRTVGDLGDHLLVLTTSDQRHGDEAMNDGKKTVQRTIKGPWIPLVYHRKMVIYWLTMVNNGMIMGFTLW
jgi:hypothetical protein